MRLPLAAVLPALLLSGCAGGRVKQPTSTEHGALAARVSLKGREFPNWIRHRATEVYWARVNAYGDLDLDHPIETTVSAKGDAYLLDVPPGRYAPFAAAYSSWGLRFMARIDNDERKHMIVELKPGAFAFAGDLELRTEFEGALVGIEHLGLRLVGIVPPFHRPTVDVAAGSPKLDRGTWAEAFMLRRARARLADTIWTERIDARLAELGNPQAPLTTGFIRKKRVPTVQAERFAYTDTLNWGKPRKIAGGLEWREPKGHARVAVSWIEAATASKPLERALEELKLAGSPEDAHVLYEVRVGSKPAESARFTSYVYPQDKLVGAESSVFVTEALIVPDKDGYYFLAYRATREQFDRFRSAFVQFLGRLQFLGPQPKST